MAIFIKNLLFTLLVPGTVGFYVPWYFAHWSFMPGTSVWHFGLLLVGTGTIALLWCISNFAVLGKATPMPTNAPRVLVIQGLYRFVRNPMYEGVLLIIAGWALYYGNRTIALYGLIVALVYHVFVVYYEEPTLKKLFGKQYEEYRRTVPRWGVKLTVKRR